MPNDEKHIFDLDDWLSGAHLPEGVVRVNRRGDVQARIEQGEADLAAAQEDGDTERAYEIAQQLEADRKAIAGEWLSIRLRGIEPAQVEKLAAIKDVLEQNYALVSVTSVDPVMTVEQAKRLAAAVGAGQWAAVVSKANALAFGEVAVPGLSLSAWTILATRESSGRSEQPRLSAEKSPRSKRSG